MPVLGTRISVPDRLCSGFVMTSGGCENREARNGVDADESLMARKPGEGDARYLVLTWANGALIRRGDESFRVPTRCASAHDSFAPAVSSASFCFKASNLDRNVEPLRQAAIAIGLRRVREQVSLDPCSARARRFSIHRLASLRSLSAADA